MSTSQDRVQNGVIDLGNGVKATPNGDGTYTVTGGDAEDNGVWYQVPAGTEGAWEMEAPGTQFDGTSWMKR